MPGLAAGLDHRPARPRRALYSTTPTVGAGQQRHHHLLQRRRPPGPDHQPRRATPRSPPSTPTGGPTAARTPTNVAAWLSAHPSGTYPYLCPATPPRAAARDRTPATRPPSSTPPGGPCRQTDQVGDTTSYTYDPAGQTLTTTDPRGKVTTNCYYYQNATGAVRPQRPGRRAVGRRPVLDHHPGHRAPTPPGRPPPTPTIPASQTDTTTTPAGTTTDTYDANGDLTSVAYTTPPAGMPSPPTCPTPTTRTAPATP